MKKSLVLAATAALCFPMFSGAASAGGAIQSACMRSDRGASPALCGCIQQVANMTLRGADQRRAAKFFRDPDQAQEVRMSKRDSDNEFWARYKAFGDAAEAYCAN
ncbi:MAG: hypothetical protein QM656_10925 [Paracoccaceae bacterium]